MTDSNEKTEYINSLDLKYKHTVVQSDSLFKYLGEVSDIIYEFYHILLDLHRDGQQSKFHSRSLYKGFFLIKRTLKRHMFYM